MFLLSVQREFRASHAISVQGEREETHEHTWRVRVEVQGGELDGDELLCDFHVIQDRLDAVLAALDGCNLNQTPPFDRINPTAEAVARHIGEAVAAGLPEGVHLSRASVTEAPGCEATYVREATERRRDETTTGAAAAY